MGRGIHEIESAVLTEMRNSAVLSYVESFELYDGQFDITDVNQFKGQLPACFVSYSGDRFAEVSPVQTYMNNMRISVIVASRNLRGNFESKTGPAGSLQMLDDVKTLLHKNNLGFPDVVGMVLIGRDPLIVSKTLSLFAMEFRIEFVD